MPRFIRARWAPEAFEENPPGAGSTVAAGKDFGEAYWDMTISVRDSSTPGPRMVVMYDIVLIFSFAR
jgi:hypothetical protein